MRGLHVLQHVPMEGAGRIGELAQAIGLAVTIHPLFEGSPVPTAIPAGDALVVMGGSMGVGDIGDARWPFLAAEVELMARQVRSEAPVLGVCLGAQLLASALGAKVYPLRVGDPPAIHREVGWGAVTFVAPAGTTITVTCPTLWIPGSSTAAQHSSASPSASRPCAG